MATHDSELLAITAEIVGAHVGHNTVTLSDLPALISKVYEALAGAGEAAAPAALAKCEPAVPIRSSIKPDYLVCLEDGRRVKTLRRHLMTDHQLTPDDYRAKWKLPADYPMVAPSYAAQRRTMALAIGLGRKRTKLSDVEPDIATRAVPSGAEPIDIANEAQTLKRTRKPRLKIAVG